MFRKRANSSNNVVNIQIRKFGTGKEHDEPPLKKKTTLKQESSL
jgi:hypothetical protein